MKAKPTLYKGIPFRSRLEARWAAFFDLLGWQWEYEPIDFNGWFPDFVIFGKRPIYVEVKPVIEFPKKVAEKMVLSLPDDFKDSLLIVGQRLLVVENQLHLGWINYPFCNKWHSSIIGVSTPGVFDVSLSPTIGLISGNKFCVTAQSYESKLTDILQMYWGKAHEETRFKKGSAK